MDRHDSARRWPKMGSLWARGREPLAVGDLRRLRRQLAFRVVLFGLALYLVLTAVMVVPLVRMARWDVLALDALTLAWGAALLLVDRPPLRPSAVTVLPPLTLIVAYFYATFGPGDVRPALTVALSVVAGMLGGNRAVWWVTGVLAAAVAWMGAALPLGYGPWMAARAAPPGTLPLLLVKTFTVAGLLGSTVATILEHMGRGLRASEHSHTFYQLLAEHATDVVWTADLSLRNTYMSPSIERLRGYTPQELQAQPIEERMTARSLELVRGLLREHLALIEAGDPRGWEPALFDLEQPHKAGGMVITSNHVRIVPGPDGRPESLVGVSRDVTATRRTERIQRLQARLATRFAEASSLADTAQACLDAALEVAGVPDGALLVMGAGGAADGPAGVECLALTPGLQATLGGPGEISGHAPAGQVVLDLVAARSPRGAGDERPARDAPEGWGGTVRRAVVAGQPWTLALFPLGPDVSEGGYVLLASQASDALRGPCPWGLQEVLHQAGRHVAHGLARRALDASERRYRALTENSLDTIMRLDRSGRYLYSNGAIEQLTGFPPEHFVGGTLATVGLPPRLRASFERLLADVTSSGRPADLTYYLSVTDRWVDMRVVPELDDQGRVVSVITTSRDVTTRKRAEQALQASERRYRTLFEAANDGILLLAPPAPDSPGSREGGGGVFLEANQRAAEILGGHIDDLVGHTPLELSPPLQPGGRPSRELARDKVRAALAGVPQVFEWRHELPGGRGRPVDVEVSLHKVALADGVYLQTTWRDLTEAKRAQRALEGEARFRAVLGEIANDFIRLPAADFEAGIQRALAAVGGALGAQCAALLSGEPRPGGFEQRQRWVAGGGSSGGGVVPLDGDALNPDTYARLARLETVSQSRRGPHPGTVVLEPLGSQGRCLGALACRFEAPGRRLSEPEGRLLMIAASTLATTMERQRAERDRQVVEAQLRQAQKLEAVGLLAGGVAHDFNNILSAIGGTAELLMDDAERDAVTPQSVHTLAQDIATATERAAELTRQLFAFARRRPVQPTDVPVARALASIQKMLRRLLGDDIALSVEVAEGVEGVRVDPGQLDQVLVNLAVNARDAMRGGGRVEITARPVELDRAACRARGGIAPGPYVLLTVADTGHGMPPEVRDRAFDPFFTTKDLGKGTGLGLSTVHGIVHGAGGHVSVETAPDVGTTFSIYLPRVPLPVTEGAPPGRAGTSEPDQRRGTILLVEDAPDVRALAAGLLKRLGYEVLQASTPTQALELLGGDAPGPRRVDLLLTDVIMPQMNGRQLAEAVRERLPGLPVLFTSGYTRNILDGAEALVQEVHFLPKPYSMRTLAEAVRAALGSASEGPAAPGLPGPTPRAGGDTEGPTDPTAEPTPGGGSGPARDAD